MRVTIVAKCTRDKFLSIAKHCGECRQRNDYTYAFYMLKKDAYTDKYNLNKKHIESEIVKGWYNW